MHWLLTLPTPVFGRAASFTCCCSQGTLDTCPLSLVHLDDVVSPCTGDRMWVGSRVPSRTNVPYQPQDDLLQEILEVGPLGLDHLRVAISRHNIRIVCGGHHQVVEDAPPPLLGPVMDDVITHHLVHEVNPFHVFLVVGHGCRDCHLLGITTHMHASRHGSHCCRVVEVRQDTHWLCVLPHYKRQLVLLCHLVLVLLQSHILRQQKLHQHGVLDVWGVGHTFFMYVGHHTLV